jgi:hypothetical protein
MLAKNSKRAVESILVADGNQALATGGQPIISSSGYNVANEQLAVFCNSYNGVLDNGEVLTAGDTVQDAPVITLAQGTPFSSTLGSQAIQGLADVNILKSSPIDGRYVLSVDKQSYVAPRATGWVIGGSGSGAVVPLDNTVFGVKIAFNSARGDQSFSKHIRQAQDISFLTPDFTALGTVSPTDLLLQNLVSNINKLSSGVTTNGNKGQFPFIALAVDANGSGGVGTLFSGLTAGVNLGSTYGNYVVDAQFAAAIVAVIANNADISGSSRVVPINLATAGAVANTDSILIVSLSDKFAVEDRVWQKQVDLQVGLPYGFNSPTVYSAKDSVVLEGEGGGRQWEVYFKNTAAQRQTQNRSLFPFLTPYVPVDAAATYVSYQIEHYEVTENGIAANLNNPLKSIVLIESGDTTTQAQFEAVMNPWLLSLSNPLSF